MQRQGMSPLEGGTTVAGTGLIPNTEGEATLLGQRALSVLPAVYRVWVSVRLLHLHEMFWSWVLASVLRAGSGFSSTVVWCPTSLDLVDSLASHFPPKEDVALGSECLAQPVNRLRDGEEQGLTKDRSKERWWSVLASWQRVRNS